MAHDYSVLFTSENGLINTWESIYIDSQTLPWNVQNIIKKTVFLPQDFYEVIAAYYMLPSALCRTVPYLFIYGQSGSGKSTLAKFASYVHGVDINASGDTFAGIRNSLDSRRHGWAEAIDLDDAGRTYNKKVERNTCMVWEDIDPDVFVAKPEIYRMFKFGYDRRTDKIILSSKEVGQNLEFHCFCPKIFSSISPLHLDDRFKELRRRLIVIPCKKVEELDAERRAELGVEGENWVSELLDLDTYEWKGFNHLFDEFWDVEQAQSFLTIRQILNNAKTGLTSQQRVVSLDLLACGISCGIWADEDEAVAKLKDYWSWFKEETEQSGGLSQLIKEYLATERKNARSVGLEPIINARSLRLQIETWYEQGWLLERPKTTLLKQVMLDYGWRLNKGVWSK